MITRRPLSALRTPLWGAALAALVLASCSTPEEPPPPPPVVPALAPVALNQDIIEAASVYVAFIREISTVRGGFQSAESIQAAMRKGAAYEPGQISRGMIAYAAVVALQSPEFVASVRGYATTPEARDQLIRTLLADPSYAATLPGADKAAGLVVSTLARDAVVLTAIADSVENDAYTIQERTDPRRRWATVPVVDRPGRIAAVKAVSAQPMLPSAPDAARLFAAAHQGQGLNLSAVQGGPPYSPMVARALTIAALASLAGAGEDGKIYTTALSDDADGLFCLNLSKLNLYQCLAASRPSYEDMFCLGRHIVRDLATCTTTAIGGLPSVVQPPEPIAAEPATVSAYETAAAPTMTPVAAPTATPIPVQVTVPAATPAPAAPAGTSPTARPYLPEGQAPAPAASAPAAATPSQTSSPRPYSSEATGATARLNGSSSTPNRR